MIEILTGEYKVRMLPENREIELDLGCGKGGYVTALAQRYPDKLIIGADIMLGRLRKLERKTKRMGMSNVEIWRVTAWDLVGFMLPDRSLNRVHVLNPDPWPKKRHRVNRLLSSAFVGRLSKKIVTGGVLHISTDDQQYLSFIHEAVSPLPCYTPDSSVIRDVCDLKSDFELAYEKENIPVTHLAYLVV